MQVVRMRYYYNSTTLFVRGRFRAASTGTHGGIGNASSLMLHTVPEGVDNVNPARELELVAAAAGLGQDYFGLPATVPVVNLCIFQYDFVTVFIAAAMPGKSANGPGSIGIIVNSGEGLTDSALLELIMVASEAKAETLAASGSPCTGTPADAVITASEGDIGYVSGGRHTAPGQRVREAVLFGVQEALRRSEGAVVRDRPSFFIFSRFKGAQWIEWTPADCPYYPCHFEGQSCDFCYCPFHPCGDESLGQWSTGSNGGSVWNCSRCTLLHEQDIAGYLKKYPEASRVELIRLRERNSR